MLSIYHFVAVSVLHQLPLSPSNEAQSSSSSSLTSLFSLDHHQVAHFLLVTGLWLLQQTLLAVNLCSKTPHPDREELEELRKKFFLYDSFLSNEISVADFQLLLEDLGADYEEEEMEVILQSLDEDQMGLIEFPTFLQWWAAE